MGMTQDTIFITSSYDFDDIVINEMAGNKLFCTFIEHDKLQDTVSTLTKRYTILYSKVFVLESPDTEELILTYNIDAVNTNAQNALPNTILLHRKKESNTLYTINALNALIRELNAGILDTNYRVNWVDFRNTILLTQDGGLRKVHTKIHTIVEI
jgi:hypothetical protein